MTHQEEKPTENWIIRFREFFKPIVDIPQGYEGSYMLYAPYEEVVHFVETVIRETKEEAFKEGLKENIKNSQQDDKKWAALVQCIREDGVRDSKAELLEKLEEEVKSIEKENSSDVNPYKQAFFEGGNEALKQVHQILSQHKINI